MGGSCYCLLNVVPHPRQGIVEWFHLFARKFGLLFSSSTLTPTSRFQLTSIANWWSHMPGHAENVSCQFVCLYNVFDGFKSQPSGLFGRQIKNIDIPSYLPSSGLAQGHIFNLCHSIFEKRVSIKHSLRKGVWMHLVGVFPPELKERDERERYIEKLRMVYDSLKGD